MLQRLLLTLVSFLVALQGVQATFWLKQDGPAPGAFIGCINPLELVDGFRLVDLCDSRSQCINKCGSLGYSAAHWGPILRGCKCSSTGHTKNRYATGKPGGCPILSFESYATRTDFRWQSCPSAVGWDKLPADAGVNVRGGPACLAHCRGKRYALTMPGPRGVPCANGDVRCQCVDSLPSMSGNTCARNGFFFYEAPVADEPQPSAKRRRLYFEQKQQLALKLHSFCPAGTDACKVSEDPEDGYECVNTEAELESCGGCRFGVWTPPSLNSTVVVAQSTPGINCGALANIDPRSVSCITGQCAVSRCAKGFKLVDGQCTK